MIKIRTCKQNIFREYGTVHALQDVSIHVEKVTSTGYRIFGAGKSFDPVGKWIRDTGYGKCYSPGENLGNLRKKRNFASLEEKSEWFFSNLIFLNQKQCITTLHCH